MARLYGNENFPFPVVEELRNLGHDVVTANEAGNAGKGLPDREVLAFAVTDGRIMIAINRKHFVRLHSQSSSHEGIIVWSFDPDFVALARRVHAALAENMEMTGKLLRINRPA